MTPAEVQAERLAICAEAGVRPERARAIAACEGRRAKAVEMRCAWRCDCDAHPRKWELA